MADKTYTIGEVAKRLGVEGKNSSTIRLWTATFADWLSPSTQPIKGQPRLYTADDLALLTAIRDLRRQHVPYDEIRSRLTGREVEALEEADAGAEKDDAGAGDAPLAGESVSSVANLDELKEVLAPLFHIAESLGRYSSESHRLGFEFQVHFGRLESSIEALGERIDRLQSEMRMLRESQTSTGVVVPKEEKAGDRRAKDKSQPAAPAPVSAVKPERPAPQQPAPVSPVPVATPPRTDSPPALTDGQKLVAPAQPSLNRYGLHPFPERLVSRALGSHFLCKMCGSATRPLGVTPTARAVLSCIECGERVVVPLDEIEESLGLRQGFWSRLRGPFSRKSS